MKKTLLGLLAGAALCFTAVSCGPKLLTEEQVSAEIQKGFEAGRPAVESEVNSRCDAEFEMRVMARVDSLWVADSLNAIMGTGM
jgi:hypothetical protein